MARWGDLSAREDEILAAVGRRLSNGEIAALMHVSVRTVESHIASLRRKLDVDSRAAMVEAANRRRPAAVTVPQNSFVGRDADLEAVDRLLGTSRSVTVVGPAGAGKTRLVLELSARSDRNPVVVDLADVAGRDVERRVAHTVGVGTEGSDDLVGAIAVGLADGLAGQRLLVLDNCDRVTADARDLVARLLPRVPTVTVLATSRTPLGGTDEAVLPLQPLAVDDTGDAVQLFLDRAAASAPMTAIGPDDTALVASVCRRLDGLPLAIELAAARLRQLSLTDLASRLADGFGALERSGSGDRHRTLEAALAWTWDLLDDDERDVLCRLAALPRGFDLDLACVIGGPGADDVALRLLDRSLLSPAVTHGSSAEGHGRRFRVLESVRAFVLARTAPEVVAAVLERHAQHFVDRAGQVSGKARIDDSPEAKAEADWVCADVNAALTWSLAHDRGDHAIRLTRALSIGVEQYAADVDSIAALTAAATSPMVLEAASARDLFSLGCALGLGDLGIVDALAARALALADDDGSRMAAEALAGHADAYQDRGRSALVHLEAAERLAVELRDTWHLAAIRQGRGLALSSTSLGDATAALDAFEAAMETYALAGDAMHVNNCRFMMASTAAEAGIRTDQALAWAEQCIAYTRATENEHELAHALFARSSLVADADPEALREIAVMFRAAGDLHCLTRTYLRMTDLAPADEQVPLLRQAADIARVGRHVGRQTEALERLVTAYWDTGRRHDAAVALGELSVLVGDEEAQARCPGQLAQQLDEWSAAIVMGRAHARAS